MCEFGVDLFALDVIVSFNCPQQSIELSNIYPLQHIIGQRCHIININFLNSILRVDDEELCAYVCISLSHVIGQHNYKATPTASKCIHMLYHEYIVLITIQMYEQSAERR